VINLKPKYLIIQDGAPGTALLKLTTDSHEALCSLSATAELLVLTTIMKSMQCVIVLDTMNTMLQSAICCHQDLKISNTVVSKRFLAKSCSVIHKTSRVLVPYFHCIPFKYNQFALHSVYRRTFYGTQCITTTVAAH